MGAAGAADILPIGTVDYSDALTNAAAFRPNVLIDLMGGEDQVNSLKEIVRFGLTDQVAVGGALFELENTCLSRMQPGSAGGPWNGGGMT